MNSDSNSSWDLMALWMQFSFYFFYYGLLCILGGRLHDLQVNVGVNDTEHTCGFYKGPAKNEDRIIMFCTSLAHGSYVTLTILSLQGETDILHVCEIQIFVKNWFFLLRFVIDQTGILYPLKYYLYKYVFIQCHYNLW